MKIDAVNSDQSVAEIIISPEHPAEIALINLFASCEANCQLLPPTDNGTEPKLKINVTVKKSRY